jgi:hypothetical protein
MRGLLGRKRQSPQRRQKADGSNRAGGNDSDFKWAASGGSGLTFFRGWCSRTTVMDDSVLFKGRDVEFQDEGPGTIADETEDAIYIISSFFTGWMLKAEYFDLLGVED